MSEPSHCLLISDFTVKSFANYLEADEEAPAVTTSLGPFGQVEPVLIDGQSEAWKPAPECVVVWTQPHAVVPAFGDVLQLKKVATSTLVAEVDRYAALVAKAAGRARIVLVPSWVAPTAGRGWGLLDLRPGQGIQAALGVMNTRLAEKLAEHPNVFVLDAQRWLRAGGKNASAQKLWFMGKVPFANEVLAEAAKDVRAAIHAVRGETRKLIVVDLDDTMWGGILGDVGWEHLVLGGHHHAGEAFVEFQRALKALTHRGLILGIVSKNTEAVALEAIDKHPEMHLRRGDFAGWKINWRDKAQNIIDLAKELRLGLQSVVFLDDNPIERARVRETLPEVLVPEWPKDPMLYAEALRSLRCFDVVSATAEDAARAEMYQAEREREHAREEAGSIDAWLASLETTVTVEPLTASNVIRTAQLLNKTNQMNLRTRRLTEKELSAWAEEAGHRLWAFRVADRLGDSGLTGIAGLEIVDGECRVSDYVLSCRVMGRKVEETLLAWLVKEARALVATEKPGTGKPGTANLVAELLPTAKNLPCLELLRRSGFTEETENRFVWPLAQDYASPEVIRVVAGSGEEP